MARGYSNSVQLEVAIETLIVALIGLIGAVTAYVRARTKAIEAVETAKAEARAEVEALGKQTERRMRRLTESAGLRSCITPAHGVPVDISTETSERHKR